MARTFTAWLVSAIIFMTQPVPLFAEDAAPALLPQDTMGLIPAAQGDIQQQDQSTMEGLAPVAAALNGGQQNPVVTDVVQMAAAFTAFNSKAPQPEAQQPPAQPDLPPGQDRFGFTPFQPNQEITAEQELNILVNSRDAWEALRGLRRGGVGPPTQQTVRQNGVDLTLYTYPDGTQIVINPNGDSFFFFRTPNGSTISALYRNGSLALLRIVLPDGSSNIYRPPARRPADVSIPEEQSFVNTTVAQQPDPAANQDEQHLNGEQQNAVVLDVAQMAAIFAAADAQIPPAPESPTADPQVSPVPPEEAFVEAPVAEEPTAQVQSQPPGVPATETVNGVQYTTYTVDGRVDSILVTQTGEDGSVTRTWYVRDAAGTGREFTLNGQVYRIALTFTNYSDRNGRVVQNSCYAYQENEEVGAVYDAVYARNPDGVLQYIRYYSPGREPETVNPGDAGFREPRPWSPWQRGLVINEDQFSASESALVI